MIHSKEKIQDIEDLNLIINQIEISLRMYGKTGTPSFMEIAESMMSDADTLRERVRTTDYTEREVIRKNLDKIIGL